MDDDDECQEQHVYRSMEAALRRIEALKGYGIWPGLIMVRDGWPRGWRLTYDPPYPSSMMDAHGYVQDSW